MIIDSYIDCIPCIINRADQLANKYLGTKVEKYDYMHDVLSIIQEADFSRTSPVLTMRAMNALKVIDQVNKDYECIKEKFNERILRLKPVFEEIIDKSNDSLKKALQFSIAGNIIDLGAFESIDFKLVDDVIEKAQNEPLDREIFNRLLEDLRNSERLLYIGDNSGEIVFDHLLINQLKKAFPKLEIIFAVRGGTILNDITRKDAKQVGLDQDVRIIDSGVNIPGTDLLEVSDDFNDIFYSSDIIISKGQGNYESLSGCLEPIYYLFLAKCNIIQQHLNKGFLESVFIHEEQLKKRRR
ncbi:MAG TPA: ARMT1-like domain-containing protein [Clostridia bacterium]|nr:ARMT1-like domain-containing protein [Clostridia bacterium]